ncbi:hypothetical protein CC80DRAFT_315882 [Byssothecium circinans]|uniref:Uncharacterized protein n=1 Tax=Byssothecium circinans TaxID=147558 RepID=A0A6A5T9J4_9PLEO|nr:hypothetical protein CC80DRAFT_315882 [Byssothecium circinans]
MGVKSRPVKPMPLQTPKPDSSSSTRNIRRKQPPACKVRHHDAGIRAMQCQCKMPITSIWCSLASPLARAFSAIAVRLTPSQTVSQRQCPHLHCEMSITVKKDEVSESCVAAPCSADRHICVTVAVRQTLLFCCSGVTVKMEAEVAHGPATDISSSIASS